MLPPIDTVPAPARAVRSLEVQALVIGLQRPRYVAQMQAEAKVLQVAALDRQRPAQGGRGARADDRSIDRGAPEHWRPPASSQALASLRLAVPLT